MKNLTFYLVIVIIVLGGFTFTFYSLNKKHKQDAVRWEQNTQETKKQIQQQNLTLSEFKEYMDIKTDSILKVVNIKPKNVTQVTNYNTYYADTTITEIKPEYEPKTGTYSFIDKQGCFEFSGFIEVIDTLPKLSVKNRAFYQDFTEIEYYEKDTIHFIGLNFVKWWQKKQITYTLVDNCTGDQRVKKFNIK